MYFRNANKIVYRFYIDSVTCKVHTSNSYKYGLFDILDFSVFYLLILLTFLHFQFEHFLLFSPSFQLMIDQRFGINI